MKKLLLLIVALTLTFVLAGCSLTEDTAYIDARIDEQIEAEITLQFQTQLYEYINEQIALGFTDVDEIIASLEGQLTIEEWEALLDAIDPTIIEIPQVEIVTIHIPTVTIYSFIDGNDCFINYINGVEAYVLWIELDTNLVVSDTFNILELRYFSQEVQVGSYTFDETWEFNTEDRTLEDYAMELQGEISWNTIVSMYEVLELNYVENQG